MPTLCLQCALRAMVEGRTYVPTDEEPEAHAARVHPDPIETQRERRELERNLAASPLFKAWLESRRGNQ